MPNNNKTSLPSVLWNEMKFQWSGREWSGDKAPMHIRMLQKTAVVLLVSQTTLLASLAGIGVATAVNAALNGHTPASKTAPIRANLNCG